MIYINKVSHHREILIVLLSGILLFHYHNSIQAQELNKWTDYESVIRHYPWLQYGNAAALTTFANDSMAPQNIAMASAEYQTINGSYHDTNESKQMNLLKAQAESYIRLSGKTVVAGGMEYSAKTDKQCGLSAMLFPYDAPMNITEYTPETTGKREQDTYRIYASGASKLSKNLSVGAALNYMTSNSAKQKDPRNKNKLMKLDASAGLHFVFSEHWSMGIDYLYSRQIEGLSFRTYGNQDKVYHYLIDYGAYYGIDEQLGPVGYTSTDFEKPLTDIRHSVSLQVGLAPSVHIQWLNGVTLTHRSGHYGEQSLNTVELSRHQSNLWKYQSGITVNERNNLHSLRFTFENEKLLNRENIFRSVTQEGGRSDFIYYGSKKVGEHCSGRVHLCYISEWEQKQFMPTWKTSANICYAWMNRTASIFPFYRQQEIKTVDTEISLAHTMRIKKYLLTLDMTANMGFGNGNAQKDGNYATPSDEQMAPDSHQPVLMQQYEYLTATHYGTTLTAKWFIPMAKQSLRLLIFGSAHMEKATGIEYLQGKTRNCLSIGVGCHF